MDHVGKKSRSLSLIIGKPCVRYKGHFFQVRYSQNLVRMFASMKSLSSLKLGNVRSKVITRSDLRNTVYALEATFSVGYA